MTELREQFEAFLAGDDAAFAELYREANPRLSAYCHKISPADADDLMQELWERVIDMRSSPSSARGGGRGVVASPMAFLFRMLKNLAIDEHRKRIKETTLEDDPTDQADRSIATYEEEELTSLEAIILEAFEKLKAEDKEVLALNIYSGFSFGEIAEMLGKSVDAVWQQASRARVKLRKIVIDDARRMGISLPTAAEKKIVKREVTV